MRTALGLVILRAWPGWRWISLDMQSRDGVFSVNVLLRFGNYHDCASEHARKTKMQNPALEHLRNKNSLDDEFYTEKKAQNNNRPNLNNKRNTDSENLTRSPLKSKIYPKHKHDRRKETSWILA